MKKYAKIIVIILVVISLGVGGFFIVKSLTKNPNDPNPPNTPHQTKVEQIGIGGGGAFFNPMIDPTNSSIYYVTSDMGALYYSYNKGQQWNRTESRGVFNTTHIAQNGTVFVGGFGLYASYDKGKTVQLIYPQNVLHSVSRCGWNENLMLAEGYNNGYLKCVTSNQDKIYFGTVAWEGEFRLYQSDYYGNNLQMLNSQQTGIVDPMSDIEMHIIYTNSGLYVSFGTKISFYNFSTGQTTDIFTPKGYIKDMELIDGVIYLIDDYNSKSEILYTTDFVTFNDLLNLNTLGNEFTKYGRDGTFNWHFTAICGNNFNNMFLLFSSPVNEFTDTVDGVLKFDGTQFEWVFDSMFKTRHITDLNGWSYGCHGPFYGITTDPNQNDFCLVANIETVYSITYPNEQNKQIKTLHGNEHGNGIYSTNGLNVQTTYSVHHDPFNNDHIIICTTDLGLQNSYDGGKTFSRMQITGDDYDIYNTCYDLYFDKYQKDVVYAVFSSRHDAPYNPQTSDHTYTKGAFAISLDGGKTWNFEYSSGIPADSIPVKMSIIQTPELFTIAVATFNRGFYLSQDGGQTFTSLNAGMDTVENLIFGEDIVLTEDYIYCLTAPYLQGGYWQSACFYEYNRKNSQLTKVDLGEIVLARSLTYNSNYGLFLNVIPTYEYQWFEEYNSGNFVNKNGGIYKYHNGEFELYFSNNDGIFNSAFSNDGKLYATDTYGKVFVIQNGIGELLFEGLFNMLKNVCFSNDYSVMYITCFGGGVYKITF